jgi:ATP-dependent Clp protease ATP-binding subunit ClpC
MSIEYGNRNKTLVGFHSKDTNKIKIVEKNFPILAKESEALFLLTRDHFFTITTPQIESITQNYDNYRSFDLIKRIIANILVIPGFIIAIGLIFKSVGGADSIPQIAEFLSSKTADLIFLISMIGVILLWHDYYKESTRKVELPSIKTIPLHDLEDIRISGIKFGRYKQIDAVQFLNNNSINILTEFIKNDSVYTYDLFKYLVFEYPEVMEILRRANLKIDGDTLQTNKITSDTIPSFPLNSVRSLIIYALEEALLTNSEMIAPEHLFLGIVKIFPSIGKFLQKQESSLDILREVVRYRNYKTGKARKAEIFNPDIPYFRNGGIGGQWIYGYTFTLGHFSKDLNEEVAKTRDVYGIGQEEAIEALTSVLGKVTNKHALLIGEPGVGKTSVVWGVAQRMNSGEAPEQLQRKKIIQLDLNSLIAVSGDKNTEDLVKKAMHELETAGNVILFIDEMQELMPAKAEGSGQSISSIILPYLMNSKFPVIGTVNYADYKKYFYENETLRQIFTNIEIEEMSAFSAMEILETKVDILEDNFNIFITFPALVASVELAKRYDKERKLPSSAAQLLESACSWAQTNGINILTEELVSKTLSIQKKIPVTDISADESTKLMNLEEDLKKKVIGQDEAIKKVSETLKRSRTDIRNPNKPIGVFLFIGPTGVGKTHLAKTISEEYFNDKEGIIRVDMSEYQDIGSIDKFLGSSESSKFGQVSISLIDKIKAKPYGVVLFDEIEKAHPQILDLFLQIFDEGRLTSNTGETVDFTNSIIICTSNIGSKIIIDSLREDASLWEDAKARAEIELRQALRPELLNRFDDIIFFSPLTLEELTEVSNLLLTDLAKRLSEKNLTLQWNPQISMLIANKGQEPGMGARPLRRFIQDKIESNIAEEMIKGSIKSGDTVTVKESWLT